MLLQFKRGRTQKFALFLFITLFISSSFAQSELAAHAYDLQWLRLVHYHKSILGYESQADGKDFFLSPQGKKNPAAELEATFKSFQTLKLPETHTFKELPSPCLFPARWHYLKKQFPEQTKEWKFPKCEKLEKFLSSLEAGSVSLIFSSYYLNSPSSSFGHTFLRFNISGQNSRNELLDFGINYAATMHPNFFITNFGGLFGYLPGYFTSVPFYYKVQEYSNMESRDLWEYQLNLEQEEIDQLARHFWELGHTYFDYFYLTENCSYHMLSAIEAVAPRLNILDRVPFYVIPIDTVKAVSQTPGLVKKINFRPSKRSQLLARLSVLDSDQKNKLESAIEELEDPNKKANLKNLDHLTLDAAIDYWDYRFFDKLIKKDPFYQERKGMILQTRSQIPERAAELALNDDQSNAPHKSHGSARSGAGVSISSTESAAIFSHRFALHDLQDPKIGYPPGGEIEFFNIQLRALSMSSEPQDPTSRLRLDHFYPAAVRSFDPMRPFIPTVSWRFRFGAERVLDTSCKQCVPAVLQGAVGKSVEFFDNRLVFTGLMGFDVQADEQFGPNPYRAGAGPEVYAHLLFKNWSLGSSANYRQWLVSSQPQSLIFEHDLRIHLSKRVGVDFSAHHSSSLLDVQGQLFIYY